jgi:hypothetical protein
LTPAVAEPRVFHAAAGVVFQGVVWYSDIVAQGDSLGSIAPHTPMFYKPETTSQRCTARIQGRQTTGHTQCVLQHQCTCAHSSALILSDTPIVLNLGGLCLCGCKVFPPMLIPGSPGPAPRSHQHASVNTRCHTQVQASLCRPCSACCVECAECVSIHALYHSRRETAVNSMIRG